MKRRIIELFKRYRVVTIICAASLLLFGAGMLSAHLHKAYNSDDVAQQVLLKDMQLNQEPNVEGRKIYYGSDSFIIKFPLYWITNQIQYGTRGSVFATCFVLALAGLVLFIFAARWLFKLFVDKKQEFDWRAIVLVWPWTLGLFFYTLFVNPNLRNIEIGLGFAIVAGLFYWLQSAPIERKQNRTWRNITFMCLAAISIGLFYYSDPYIEYVLFVPLLLLLGYKMALHWRDYREHTSVMAVLVGSFIASVLIRKALLHFGFMSFDAPTVFAEISKISDHFLLSLQGLVALFNIDVFGKPVFSGPSMLRILFMLPLFTLLIAYRDQNVRKSLKTNFLHQFLVLHIVFTLAVFVFSNNAVDLSTTRYFVVLPFSLALLALIVAHSYSNRKVATATAISLTVLLSVVGFAYNMHSAYQAYKTDNIEVADQPIPVQTQSTAGTGNMRNRINKQIAKVALDNNLHKGYAAFWSGPINTYFAKNAVKFEPVYCGTGNKIAPYNWMLDTRTLRAPANKSFFLYDSANDFSTSDGWCGSVPKLLEQFGEPKKTIPVTDTIRFYTYDYDILQKMRLTD